MSSLEQPKTRYSKTRKLENKQPEYPPPTREIWISWELALSGGIASSGLRKQTEISVLNNAPAGDVPLNTLGLAHNPKAAILTCNVVVVVV